MPAFGSLPERIRSRIKVCPATGCWRWTGRWNSGNGYGKIRWNGRIYVAHRLVYELLVGSIPERHVLDHICRTRDCCNPAHLDPVTIQVNTHRGEAVLFERRQDACET